MSMAENLACPDLPAAHGFFTRRGGVSIGPYASLNCSLSGADDRASVSENRARAARAVGAEHGNLLGLSQVHGRDVIIVGHPWAEGEGGRADAMVTAIPGIALGIVTADCAPVLFADPGTGIVGAAHAGWRGAVEGVLEATIAAMESLGATRGRIVAAIGPCIRQTSYEVSDDLRDAVLASGGQAARFFTPGRMAGKYQFDHAGYCAARLIGAGIGAVLDTGADTLPDADGFFSHRRRTLAGGGPIGHQISVIRA